MSESAWNEIRMNFAWEGSGVYLNTAAEGLLPRIAERGFARYFEAKALGSLGRPALARIESEARTAIARLIGGSPDDFAFVSSTSRALAVAVGLTEISPGANVVMLDSEFPSAILTGQMLSGTGVELRLVPAIGTDAGEEQLANEVDEMTAAVIVSSVSFITGRMLDFRLLRNMLGARRPVVIVDAIQSAGLFDLPLDEIDVLMFGTYKWLLGPHGVAALYCNPRTMRDRSPAYRGWRGVTEVFHEKRMRTHTLHRDARRFEDGMPNYLGLAVLLESMSFLESIGREARESYTKGLVDAFVSSLNDVGILCGPSEPSRRAGIVTIPVHPAENVADALAKQGFHVWGRERVLRVSPYIYNSASELAALARALPPLLKGLERRG